MLLISYMNHYGWSNVTKPQDRAIDEERITKQALVPESKKMGLRSVCTWSIAKKLKSEIASITYPRTMASPWSFQLELSERLRWAPHEQPEGQKWILCGWVSSLGFNRSQWIWTAYKHVHMVNCDAYNITVYYSLQYNYILRNTLW
jgi:hypothetical protein